jgi:hypothetical protein
LHKSQDLENTFDCPIGIAASPEGSRSSINATVYDKK